MSTRSGSTLFTALTLFVWLDDLGQQIENQFSKSDMILRQTPIDWSFEWVLFVCFMTHSRSVWRPFWPINYNFWIHVDIYISRCTSHLSCLVKWHSNWMVNLKWDGQKSVNFIQFMLVMETGDGEVLNVSWEMALKWTLFSFGMQRKILPSFCFFITSLCLVFV